MHFAGVTSEDIEIEIVRIRESFTAEGEACYKVDLEVILDDSTIYESMVPTTVVFADIINSLPEEKGYKVIDVTEVMTVDLRDCYRFNVKDRTVTKKSFEEIALQILSIVEPVIPGMCNIE